MPHSTPKTEPHSPLPDPPEADRMGCDEMPGFYRLLAHSRASLKAFVHMREALAGGQLTPVQREQIALAVAEINGSVYGLSAHYETARLLGLSDVEINLARQARATIPRTEAMLRFVQSVALQRGDIGDQDFERLVKAGFGAEEIVEIISHIALNIFADYCNNAARTPVDFPLLQPGFEKPGTDGKSAMAARYPRLEGGLANNRNTPI
jgi:uncharacterized peroxidase-related enzyme